MLTTLKQVYSKHSPTFIISLCPLVFSLVLIIFHQQAIDQSHCAYATNIRKFEIIVAIVMVSQLFMKSVGLGVIYKFSRELSTTFYTVFFFVFLLGHAALWAYSLVMFFNDQFRDGCKDLLEHYFFVKLYALVVSLILLIGTVMIVVLALPAAILTIKSFRNRNLENS